MTEATKPKPPRSSFLNCSTREQLAAAIQKRLATGKLKATEIKAAVLICKLRGWNEPAKRHFVGEKFSQGGVNYQATALDGAGEISEAKES